MVVRKDRDRLAASIAAYMRGEVDNFHLLSYIESDYVSADKTVTRFETALWYFYDDFKQHSIHASLPAWKMFRRMIAFLKTELEYGESNNEGEWPFSDRMQIIRSRVSLKDLGLPQYDPAIHDVPIRTPREEWWFRARIWLILLAMAMLVIAVLMT